MTRTPMADGRIICIAGEYEDFYDPDFCIYNDVIVLRPAPGQTDVTLDSGEVAIYGYPESVFPPTDFHSSTIVGDSIFIIGRLGYSGTRSERNTPVFVLDHSIYRIESVPTSGPCPGWVYRHHASYDPARHAITIRSGNIHVEGAETETPHRAAYRLHLADLRWEVIAQREMHRRFLIRKAEDSGEYREPPPDVFRPKGVPHSWLMPEDRGVSVYSIDVGGVRVVFEDFVDEVRTLVEGNLPSEVTDQLLREVVHNLGSTTGSEWTVSEV
ncbi:MAG: hypothetical protein L0Y42_09935 [Phycisphaerales bacterium]|nr:hypothetical protein [Phycisphaerales bacterium]